MSTPPSPGPGWQPQEPWGQQPGQPPQPWGQQPQQPQQPWGQQPQQPWGQPQQPWGQPHQPWGQQQQPAFGQPPQKSGAGRIIGIVAGVVVLISVAVLAFVFVGGAPEAGDCVSQDSTTSLETVDCNSADADYRVIGIDEEHDDLTSAEFYLDDSTCSQFQAVTQQLWQGNADDASATGTIYCLGAV